MAVQSNVDTECLLLGEFVDNAGGAESHAAGNAVARALGDLARLIAAETGVPRFKLDEVVQRIVESEHSAITERLRAQIRLVLREYQQDAEAVQKRALPA